VKRAATIEQWVVENLQPAHYEVIDESRMHRVPEGAESHFRLVIVADAFAGKSLVDRHRQVYTGLQSLFTPGALHALSLHLYSAPEWSNKNQKTTPSPACAGGDGGKDRS
jgi:BolA family transcriptional regulator, general stress-responsive regulator